MSLLCAEWLVIKICASSFINLNWNLVLLILNKELNLLKILGSNKMEIHPRGLIYREIRRTNINFAGLVGTILIVGIVCLLLCIEAKFDDMILNMLFVLTILSFFVSTYFLLIRIRNKIKHPVIKQLKKYGDLRNLVNQIDEEYLMRDNTDNYEKVYNTGVLENWLFIQKIFTTQFIRLEDFLWLYKSNTEWNINFRHYATTYKLKGLLNEGKNFQLDGVTAYLEKRFEDIYSKVPWIEIGYNEDKMQLYQEGKIEDFKKLVLNKKRQILEATNKLQRPENLTTEKLLLFGKEASNKEDFFSAKIYYSQLINRDDSIVEAYSGRAYALYKLQEYYAAISDYDKYLIQIKNNHGPYVFRGLSYYAIRDFEKALFEFEMALSKNPNIPMAICYKGLSKFCLNDKIGACEDWKHAEELGFELASTLLKNHCNR